MVILMYILDLFVLQILDTHLWYGPTFGNFQSNLLIEQSPFIGDYISTLNAVGVERNFLFKVKVSDQPNTSKKPTTKAKAKVLRSKGKTKTMENKNST